MNHQTRRAKLHIKKRWVIVALTLALALLGYYVVLGFQFLNHHADEQALTAEANQLSAILDKPAPDVVSLQADLDRSERALEDMLPLYRCEEHDDLVALIVNIADDTRVNLDQLATTEGSMKSVGDISYHSQPLRLRVSGSLKEVFSFLDLLHERAPTVELVQIGLSSLEDGAVANLELLFYLSPEYVAKESGKQ